MALVSADWGRRWNEMLSPFEEWLNRPSLLPTSDVFARRSGWLGARMDIIEHPNAYQVSIELPGVRKEDIQVQMEGSRLSIHAQRREERMDENDRYYISERSFGAIRRMADLPYNADPNGIEANFENGVLHVKIRKHSPGTAGGKLVPVQ